jgi:DNA-binding NtrC family response regulator
MIGDAVETRALPASGTVAIGRGTTCDVRIDHPSISRDHLALELTPAALRVTDRGGSNGTLLRGIRLPAGSPVEISANEPVQLGDVILVVQEVMPWSAAAGTAPRERAPSGPATGGRTPIVIDPAMKRLYDLGARVARGTIGVLLVGETGAGKEMLAEHIHKSSPRASGPLVRLNCAAFTETLVESELFGHEKGAFTGAARDHKGLLESASGGTAFFDEIGEISLAVQAKLLRVVEEGRLLPVGSTTPRAIDVRYVAATNRDLEAEVEAGRFRRDLYFRLAGAVLEIPPLRERPSEIDVLVRRYADDAAGKIGRAAPRIGEAALAALRAHAWPGNVRELRNVIERAVLLADDQIEVEHLPFDGSAPAPSAASPSPAPAAAGGAVLADELAAVERRRIVDALEQCDGNQTKAAALLGMPRRTFVKRLEQYNIPRPRK